MLPRAARPHTGVQEFLTVLRRCCLFTFILLRGRFRCEGLRVAILVKCEPCAVAPFGSFRLHPPFSFTIL